MPLIFFATLIGHPMTMDIQPIFHEPAHVLVFSLDHYLLSLLIVVPCHWFHLGSPMVYSGGVVHDKLSQVHLDDDIEFKNTCYEHHLYMYPSTYACTQNEPHPTQVDVSHIFQPKSTIVITHFVCLPIFLPTT